MLVICEDCAKKYNIDESRIKGRRARFTCNECGHIIIIDKADISRSLIGKKNPETSSSTIDLLREMEGPIPEETADDPQAPAEHPESQPEQPLVKRKNRGIPIFAYLIVAMLFALVCVSITTGYLYTEYLYSEYLSDMMNRKYDSHQAFMVKSSLVFGAAWLVILAFFTIIGRSIHNKFKLLVKNANQLGAGEDDIVIVTKGPREVRDLAFALERIRIRLQSLR